MAEPSTAHPDHRHLRAWPLWLAGLLLAALATGWSAMSAPLILDDNDSLAHVAGFQGWGDTFAPDCYGLFRPFKNAVFFAFSSQGEVNLGLWHGTLLASFLFSTTAVFFLLRSLFRSDAWALGGAAAWAMVPTQACLAAWMSCINIGFAVSFLCLFLLAHRRAVSAPGTLGPWSAAAAAILFLAQLSYEAAVAAAGLAFFCDSLAGARPALRKRVAHYVLYGVATLGFLALRQSFHANSSHHDLSLGFAPDMPLWQLSISAPWFLWKHLLMWISPPGRVEFLSGYLWGQSASMAELALAWGILLGLLGAGITLWKRVPLAALGIFWFLAASFPSSNFIPIHAGPIEDYYLIIPSIGLVIAFAALARAAAALLRKRSESATGGARAIPTLPIVAVALWRIAYVPFFALQVDLWNHPAELHLRSASTRPHQFHAKANAAKQLLALGQPEQAIGLCQSVVEEAPWYPYSYLILGHASAETGETEQALAAFTEATARLPFEMPIHQSALLGTARVHIDHTHDWDAARAALLPLLERGQNEYRIPAIHAMTDLYLAQDNRPKALATLAKGASLYPAEASFRDRHDILEAAPQAAK